MKCPPDVEKLKLDAIRLGLATRIWGPYYSKFWDRWSLQVEHDGKHITMNVSRLMMEVKLGRILNTDEQVDHIDENRLNDNEDNLQILTPTQNRIKAIKYFKPQRSKGLTYVEFVCANCQKSTSMAKQDYTRAFRRNKGNVFCTAYCGTKFGSKAGWAKRRTAQ